MRFPSEVVDYLQLTKSQDIDTVCALQINRARKQANTLVPVFQDHEPKTLLDIGCGLGLASIILSRLFGLTDVHLMDGDGSSEIFSDYREDALPWNDVSLAARMAIANVPLGCLVKMYYADPNLTIPVDIIISLKSWGTHYPVSTYLPLAVRSLKPGGLVVMDLRPGDEAFVQEQVREVVAAGFDLVDRQRRQHVFLKKV